MSDEPRDKWSKLDVIARAIGAILLPIVLLIASNTYTKEQRDSDKKRYDADRLTTMVKSLSSENERERLTALEVLECLVRSNQVSYDLRVVLDDFVTHGTPAEKSVAEAIIKGDYIQKESVSVAKSRPRVYIDICNENQRQKALEAEANLESDGFDVLSIGSIPVGPPATTQVRYFHANEQDEAKRIADVLTRVGLRNAKEVYFEEYEHDAPRRQYEVRFSVIALTR